MNGCTGSIAVFANIFVSTLAFHAFIETKIYIHKETHQIIIIQTNTNIRSPQTSAC
jgi:hypothetical protein